MRQPTKVAAGLAGAALLAIGGLAYALSAAPAPDIVAATTAKPATAEVVRTTVRSVQDLDGTLGYADAYSITNALATTGWVDPLTAAQTYAAARAQYNTAVNNRANLSSPPSPDVTRAQASLNQAQAALVAAEQTAAGPTDQQVAQAQAALASAEAQLANAQAATAGPTASELASAQAALASAQAQLVGAQQVAAGPTAAQLAAAQAAVASASATVATDEAQLGAARAAIAACTAPAPVPSASDESTPTPAPSATCNPANLALSVEEAQNRLTAAQAQLSSAQAALDALTAPDAQARAQANLTAAQTAFNAAQAKLDDLTAGSSLQTQATLAAAQAGVQAAQATLAALGDNTDQARANLTAAQAQVRSAGAALDAVLHPTKAQRGAADDAVKVAQAQLNVAAGTLARPRGLVTELPTDGTVLQAGGVLYTLDGTHPVVLMIGEVPAWRELKAGVPDGADVKQLEANLTALGFGSSKLVVDGHWDAETTATVKRWEASLGLPRDEIVALGEIVFEPGPIRVTTVRATLGDLVQAGARMFDATSTSRQVTMALDADQQDIVTLGAAVTIKLADGSTTNGTIADIGTVAVAPKEGATPQITVTIGLDNPAATGTLDGSPVTVEVVRDRHENVLAVPIEALLALSEGGYGVEVVDPSGATHLVGVQTGLFENDLVEVTSAELKAGDRVVVPG